MSTKYVVEKDWITSAGLRAVVMMGTIGFRCGYVAVPKGHALHGVDYDNAKVDGEYIDVHGGLTYAGGSDTYPAPSTEGVWWFGYDCGHLGDGRSDEYLSDMRTRYPNNPVMWDDGGDIHRTTKYCARQCELLASQLAKATRSAT